MNVMKKRRLAVPVVAAALLAVAPAAFAQKAGTYIGTNNEGDEVEVVVAAGGGGFNLTGMSDSGTVYCKGTEVGGWGVAIGTSDPITNGGVTLTVFVSTLYYTSTMTFKGKNVSGTIDFAVPVFSGTQQPPKKACSAATKKQTFTATLSNTTSVTPPKGAYAWPLLSSK